MYLIKYKFISFFYYEVHGAYEYYLIFTKSIIRHILICKYCALKFMSKIFHREMKRVNIMSLLIILLTLIPYICKKKMVGATSR